MTDVRRVFVNGCFDTFHWGHLRLLQAAREIAGSEGEVHVALNSDESVARLKGPGRPVNIFGRRFMLIKAIRHVDYAWVFAEDTPVPLLGRLLDGGIKFAACAKGSDHRGRVSPEEEIFFAEGIHYLERVP